MSALINEALEGNAGLMSTMVKCRTIMGAVEVDKPWLNPRWASSVSSGP